MKVINNNYIIAEVLTRLAEFTIRIQKIKFDIADNMQTSNVKLFILCGENNIMRITIDYHANVVNVKVNHAASEAHLNVLSAALKIIKNVNLYDGVWNL